jgi:hypothetical protein
MTNQEHLEKHPNTTIIRELNDRLRTTLGDQKSGAFFITQGVSRLHPKERLALIKKVRTFNDFNEGNDPYGEHDFGAITQNGVVYYWKIDYYSDKKVMFGSEDPSDPQKTYRVLTLLEADEY